MIGLSFPAGSSGRIAPSASRKLDPTPSAVNGSSGKLLTMPLFYTLSRKIVYQYPLTHLSHFRTHPTPSAPPTPLFLPPPTPW